MTAMRVRVVDTLTLLPEGQHFIGGEWVTGGNGQTIEVIDPSNREALHRIARGSAEDVDLAVRAAHAAFPAWRDMSPSRRASLLRRWSQVCEERGEDLATLESIEVGRPYRGPSFVGNALMYVAGLADKIHGYSLPSARPDVLGLTLREPFGVCGSIVPWNYPTALMMGDVAPAIAAGNTIVVKPASDTPLACLLLAKLAQEAGIPDGVVNVVTGYGSEAGAALPRHPLVRHMSFTGSCEAGASVMEACAKNLVPLHLELGGKSPQVVFRDANLKRAVKAIVGSVIHNTGQICVAGTRVLVEKEIRPQFVSAIADEMRKIRVGAWNEDVEMGPLASAEQEKRVFGYLDIGREEGARVVCGGQKPKGEKYERGFFVEPTLFDDVSRDMRIAQEEIFGPVLSVLTFDDPDEALEIANGTRYGLGAAAWTNDVKRALRFARGLQAGNVYVNTYGPGVPVIGAPFGGYKHSGFGRTGGIDSILEYTQIKSVIIDGAE